MKQNPLDALTTSGYHQPIGVRSSSESGLAEPSSLLQYNIPQTPFKDFVTFGNTFIPYQFEHTVRFYVGCPRSLKQPYTWKRLRPALMAKQQIGQQGDLTSKQELNGS